MDRRAFNIFRSKLARQTFALFVLSAVLPVLFIAGLSYDRVSHQLHEHSYEQSRQAGKTIAMELLRHLTLMEHELESLAASAGDTPAGLSPDIPLSKFRDFDVLALVRDGRVALTLRGTLEAVPLLTAQQETHLRQGKTLLMLLPAPQPHTELLMLRQLGTADAGLLVGRVNKASIKALESLLPGTTSLLLFGPDNRLLYTSGNWNPAVADALAQRLDSGISGHFEWGTGQERELAGYWSLFTQSEFLLPYIVVVLSQSETGVLAPISKFRTLYLPGLLLLVLLVSLVSANRIRNKLAPLVSLRDATRQVADGNFGDRVPVTSDDELADLGKAFNLMTEKLGTQFSSLATMAEIDRLILSSFDTRYIITTVLSRAGDMTPCSVCAVLEREEGDGETATLSWRLHPEADDARQNRVAMSDADVDWLESNPDGVLVEKDQNRPGFLEPLYTQTASEFLLLPTIIKQELAAVLIFGYAAGHRIGRENREQLRKFGDHVAVALSNARWEERLYNQAHYDTLTGLPNRALLKDRLEQAIARARRNDGSVGVMFVDLDRFKLVNDSLGHSAGDQLLQKIAGLLLQSVRSVDTVVRFGGDEFVIIIPDIHRDTDAAAELGNIAGKLLKRVHNKFTLGDHQVHAETSVGIALYPKDAATPDELVKHADTAMYHAKDSGRGCYRFFAPELNVVATRRLTIMQELERALENDEFRVFYQPKFDCTSGVLYGAEALIRWQHPEKGLVPPFEFIGLAEETGQIKEIGEWVLRNACKQVKAWRDAGLPDFRLSVNLSTHQFRDQDTSATVAEILAECRLEASALELEVTESALMTNTVEAISMLRRLNSMGVYLSIDDFGTGYSSLSYLKDLPLDTLKIDRSFIVGMQEDYRSEAIVSTIIVLAHNLGLDVVAEGVETEQQRVQLQAWGCDACQGYLYSPPLPVGKFTALLSDPRRGGLAATRRSPVKTGVKQR